MRGQRLREVLSVHCQRACYTVNVLTRDFSCHPSGPQYSTSLSPHLVHTSEQLPVEGSKVVGDILWLHSVNLCVSRRDLDFLWERHLVAGRGTRLGSPQSW